MNLAVALKVLLVDGDRTDVRLVELALRAQTGKFELTTVSSLKDALVQIGNEPTDIILLDLSLPDSDGIDTCAHVVKSAPHLPVVVLTKSDDEKTPIACIERGAEDYLTKGDWNGPLLIRSLRHAVERKRAKMAALEFEERYQETITNVPGVVLQFQLSPDGDYSFPYVSEGSQQLLGISPLEIMADPQAAFSLVSPEDSKNVLRSLRASAQSLAPWDQEIRLKLRDGTVRWVRGRANPKKLEDGTTVWNSVFLDVTQQKEAQRIARGQEALFQLFLRHAPTAIAMFDRELRYLAVSDRWLDDYGLKAQEILFQNPYQVRPPLPGHWREILERCLAGGSEARREDTFVRADGSTQWVHLEVHPWLDEEGRIGGLIMFSELFTEQKKLQDQLQMTQRMESIGQLAGGIAHDFNNLLTIVTGRAQLLLRAVRGQEALQKNAEIILKTGERAAALTRQLLTFSRRQRSQPRTVNLDETLREIEDILAPLLRENIELVFKGAKEPALVWIDPAQLEQVIVNLAVNAGDAMPNGGRLTFHTEIVVLAPEEVKIVPPLLPGSYVRLTVDDTGKGMGAHTLAHIFEPFFTTKQKGKGTGLGLSTVYGIVKQAEGHIEVLSEEGKGTSFLLSFPLAGEKQAKKNSLPPNASPLPKGSETILLVEDEEQLRTLAGDMLKERGYRVLTATNGEEALILAESHPVPIDLLVTDVVMPKLGGVDLARELTRRFPTLRVLFISGYTGDAVVREEDFPVRPRLLDKPFTAEALHQEIRTILGAPAG